MDANQGVQTIQIIAPQTTIAIHYNRPLAKLPFPYEARSLMITLFSSHRWKTL